MRRTEVALVVLASVAFLLAAGWRLGLPGLQYDECLAAAPAVNFLQASERAEPMHIRPSVVRLGDRPLPVMVMPYIGPVKTLAHLPFFAVFGISPATVRLLPVVAMLASLVLSWWVVLRLWGRWAAASTTALLALDPSWVFYLTRDVGPAALAVLLKLLAVAFGIGWWGRGCHGSGRWFLSGSALCLGLGVSHKVDFLWVVAGLVVPLVTVAYRDVRQRLDGRGLVLTLSAFLVGASPVVAFNLATGGHTFTPFLQELLIRGGSEPLDGFFPALATRVEQLAGLASGEIVQGLFTAPGAGGAWLRGLPAVAWLGAVAWLLGAQWGDRRGRRLELALLLHVGVVLVASCFSPTTLAPHHLLTLYPALQVAVAVALAEMVAWSRQRLPSEGRAGAAGRRRGEAAVVLGIGVLVVANLVSVSTIQSRLVATGGTGYWSDAVYALAEDLEGRFPASADPLVIMDWGFTNNLIVLTEGRLAMEPLYRELWRKPASVGLFLPHLKAGKRYLFHAPELALYEEVPRLFAAAAERRDLVPVVEARYHQRDGREVYRLVRLIASPSVRPRGGTGRGAL